MWTIPIVVTLFYIERFHETEDENYAVEMQRRHGSHYTCIRSVFVFISPSSTKNQELLVLRSILGMRFSYPL